MFETGTCLLWLLRVCCKDTVVYELGVSFSKDIIDCEELLHHRLNFKNGF